jgi:TQXA domain-containing protein
MSNRLTLARVGAAAVVVASATIVLSALPAAAANGPVGNGPAANASTTASPDPHGDKYGGTVYLRGRGSEPTALIALKPRAGGPDILTYCVEINVREGGSSSKMVQVPWTDYPDQNAAFNKNRDKINWVLHNSFPTADLTALSTAAKTPTTLSPEEAVEGTQAAIWNLSDGTRLNTSHNNANVDALYAYLLANATALPQPPASPTLQIDSPSSTSGDTGTAIGPFVVDTNLELVALTAQVPPGVTVTAQDAQGNPVDLTKIVNGTKVYFHPSAGLSPGNGTFTISGDLQLGQLYVGKDVADKAALPGGVRKNCKGATMQSLIVAQSTSLSRSANASWTAPVQSSAPPTTTTTAPPSSTSSTPSSTTSAVVVPPTTTAPPAVANTSSSLPFTGVNVLGPVILAIVLIGAGGAFLLLQRRRKRA